MAYPHYSEYGDYYEMAYERSVLLANMYFLITEREPYSFQSDCGNASYDNMPEIFSDYGLRWNHLVKADVEAIFNLQPVRYFKPTWAWVDDYRAAHRIRYKKPEWSMRTWGEACEDAISYFDQIEREFEQYGISLWMNDRGYACHNEQQYFYRSQEWQDRAAAARYEWDYQCQNCEKSGKSLHVHHSSPIVSAYHHNFDNCFASYRLHLLCEDCHRRTHERTVRAWGNYGYVGATPEEVEKEKVYFQKLHKAHDKMQTCEFCQNHGYLKRLKELTK
jgi:hypothetical protein